MTFLKTIQRGLILFAFLLTVAFWQSGLVLAQEENVEVATQVDDDNLDDDNFFDDFDDLADYEGISTGSSFADKYIRGRLGLRFGMAAQRAGRHASIPLWLARADKLDLGPVPEGEKWESMAKGNIFVFGVDYQLTDSLTINLSVPYIFMKFIPGNPVGGEHLPHDGKESADMQDQYSIQDASFDLSYMILGYPDYPVSLFASTGYRFPLGNYPTMGHASIGTRQKVLPIGLSVGRPLSLTGPVLSRTYVMAGYKVEFIEKTLDRRLNRGTYNVATAYTPFDFMSVGVSWTYSYIYGMGIWDTMEWGLYGPGGWLPEKYLDASEEEISAYADQVAVDHDLAIVTHTGILAYQLSFSFANLPPFDITYYYSLAPYTQLTMHNRNLMMNTRWSF